MASKWNNQGIVFELKGIDNLEWYLLMGTIALTIVASTMASIPIFRLNVSKTLSQG